MITAILIVIGIILSILGTVLKIQLPVLPGLFSLSIFGIGLFLLSAGLSAWFRGISDLVGPFWLTVIVAALTLVTTLGVDRLLRTYFGLDLLDELLKLIPVKWPW